MAIKITREEYLKKFGVEPDFSTARTQTQPTGGGMGQDISNAFQGSVDYAKQGYEDSKKATNPLQKVEAGLKQLTGAAGAALSPLAPVTKYIGQGVNAVADKISDIPAVQKFAMTDAGKTTARVVEDVANTSGLLGFRAVPVVGGAAKTAATNATKTAATTLGEVGKTTTNVATGLKNAVELAAEGASRIPSRIATNVAEKQAMKESINQLPTPTARQAANDGVEITDINTLYSLPKEQKNPIRQLAQVVKDYASGKTKMHPEEVVGRPIVQRIKDLDKAKGEIGQALGKAAESLGTVTTKETAPAVFAKLKEVPGLSGLTVSSKGVLNFKDTVLQTAATKSDRAAIQRIFMDAIKAGTGKQKHLLRQELFEVLDGKKKSLTTLTGTQEKAYQAVRQALSDILDTKNPQYKMLNQAFAKAADPLQAMKKYLKSTGVDEDLLNMKAGLLARRLTSNAMSNPEIRSILRAMDEATTVPGKASVSVESLQDAYNLLSKYYDIANKTGLQGQVRSGIEGATGVTDAILRAVGDMAGKTNAVRQKALESLLEETLK